MPLNPPFRPPQSGPVHRCHLSPARRSARARPALRLLAAPGALALALAPAAQADAPQQRRLELSVEMTRQGEVSNGAERGRQHLVQAWRVSAVLGSDGVRHPGNPLDAQALQRQATQATQMAAAAPVAPPSAQQLQALQAQAQALVARCGQDPACLQREARTLAAGQTARGDRALQARLLAQRPADASDDAGPAEPYLHFHGVTACQLEVGVQVDARTEGQYGDVQGQVPYTDSVRADGRHRGDAPCPLVQAVLDTRSGRLWTYLMALPQDAHGTRTREERGRRRTQAEDRVALRWMEAQTPLAQRLLQLDLRGDEDLQRLAVPGGQLTLRLRWRFEPI